MLLLSLYGKYLYSDCLQFGFKKNSGCNDAIFTFIESVNFFNQRNSKVLCTFIDASKAFDKVLVNGLLCKLIKRNAPVELFVFCIVGLMMYAVQLTGCQC